MTEAAFWGWLRSGLRKLSMRWKPYYDTYNQHRRPSKSKDKRLKYEYQCNNCKRWFSKKDCCVDHITPVGPLRSLEDLPQFVGNMFVEEGGYQVLCNYKLDEQDKHGEVPSCHYTKTQEERANKDND